MLKKMKKRMKESQKVERKLLDETDQQSRAIGDKEYEITKILRSIGTIEQEREESRQQNEELRLTINQVTHSF